MYDIIGDEVFLVFNQIKIPLDLIYTKLLNLQLDNSSNAESFTYEKTNLILKYIGKEKVDERELQRIKFELNDKKYVIYEKKKNKNYN